jgi:hypothetical protein
MSVYNVVYDIVYAFLGHRAVYLSSSDWMFQVSQDNSPRIFALIPNIENQLWIAIVGFLECTLQMVKS